MPGEPITVSGGSVMIEFDDNFTDRPAPAGKQRYQDDNAKLAKVLVNGETVAELDRYDVVKIVTTDEPAVQAE